MGTWVQHFAENNLSFYSLLSLIFSWWWTLCWLTLVSTWYCRWVLWLTGNQVQTLVNRGRAIFRLVLVRMIGSCQPLGILIVPEEPYQSLEKGRSVNSPWLLNIEKLHFKTLEEDLLFVSSLALGSAILLCLIIVQLKLPPHIDRQ